MLNKKLKEKDELRNQLEGVLIYSFSVRDSMRLFEQMYDPTSVQNDCRFDSILQIYVVLLEEMVRRLEKVLASFELVTEDEENGIDSG